MPVNSFPMSLSSLSKVFVIFFSLTAGVSIAQKAVVKIDVAGLNGENIRVAFPQGVVMRTDIPRFRSGDKNDEIIIQRDVSNFEVLQLSYGDAFKDVILQPGDSLELFWHREYLTWEFIKSSALNMEVDSLNIKVNKWLLDMVYSQNSSKSLLSIRSKIDSLKELASSKPDDFISTYQWHAAADIDLIINPQAIDALRSVYFKGRKPYPMHPAWIFSFNSFFEGDILKRLNAKSGQELRKAIESEDWRAVEAAVMKDTSVSDSSLVKWIVLKDVYELTKLKDFELKLLFNLLSNGLNHHKSDSVFASEVKAILAKWSLTIPGNPFPNLEVFSFNRNKSLVLNELSEKPMYLVYLPDQETSSMLILSELVALQKKYGEEIHFAVLIDLAQGDSPLHENKAYSGLEFLNYSYSSEALSNLFTQQDQAGFALIDRYFKTYSFPAEGPETGVENSFLGLIKK